MKIKTRVLKFLPPVVSLLLFLPFCSRLKYDVRPDSTAVYFSVTIKVNVKLNDPNSGSPKRQNFKILLKFDRQNDKMLFLSPLNQVYGQLFIENEKVLLINTKEKKYWKGRFNTLIDEIWALDFTYSQFKDLILNGTIPEERVEERRLRLSLETDEKTGKPQRITINYNDAVIKLRISDHRSGKGIIDFSHPLKHMEAATIEEALGSR
jgi:hypothetical protein